MRELMLDELNEKRMKHFSGNYELESVVDCSRKFFLGDKVYRVCRFCKRSKPEVKFKMDAHVIPELLGNKNLFSYYECDSCNKTFSKFESSLQAFLGPIRTFFQIRGKNGTPVFKVDENEIEIKELSGNYEIITKNEDQFKINEKDKSLTITTKKQSYIPMEVFKIFVKMGLSIVDNKYLNDYDNSFKFLFSEGYEFGKSENDLPLATILYYFVPLPGIFEIPTISIYKKRDANLLIPFHTCIITFNYYVVQFFFPENNLDEKLLGKNIQTPVFPLLVDIREFSFLDNLPKMKNENLNSLTKKIKEPTQLSFKFNILNKNPNSNKSQTFF